MSVSLNDRFFTRITSATFGDSMSAVATNLPTLSPQMVVVVDSRVLIGHALLHLLLTSIRSATVNYVWFHFNSSQSSQSGVCNWWWLLTVVDNAISTNAFKIISYFWMHQLHEPKVPIHVDVRLVSVTIVAMSTLYIPSWPHMPIITILMLIYHPCPTHQWFYHLYPCLHI